ncbi:MAG: oligosaccharide flippase family protein, partial [Candidatus Gastranaerophilales bacterium]|nr:oligosaccharide flippase family protein [Candidatus Gastranaerophilales bacterium]
AYQLTSLLIVFLLMPLMIKILGDYKYGVWILVTIMVNYMGFTELGVTSAIQRNLAVAIGDKNREEFNRIFSNGLFLNFIILILVLIITYISVLVINFIHFKEYHLISLLITIMGINLALTFPFKSFLSVIAANIRFEIISGIMLSQLVITSLLTVALLLNGYGLIGLAVSTLMVTLFTNCLYVYFAKKIYDFSLFNMKLINKSTLKKLLIYSGKTFLGQIADIIRFKMDEVVTGALISVNMVTTYSIANKLNGAANGFTMSFLGVLNPFFSKYVNIKSDHEKAELFFLVSKIVIAISFLTFFGFLILGKPFIKIWMGEHYIKAYYPLIILALGYFIAFMQSVGINYMYSTNTHQYLAYMSLGEGIINLIFSLIFVMHFKLGIIGVALGTLVPLSVTKTYIQPMIVSKLLNINPLKYYLFFAKNSSIGFALYLITGFVIVQLNIDNYIKIVIAAFILGLLAVLHLFFMLDRQEKLTIKDAVLTKLSRYNKSEIKINTN